MCVYIYIYIYIKLIQAGSDLQGADLQQAELRHQAPARRDALCHRLQKVARLNSSFSVSVHFLYS